MEVGKNPRDYYKIGEMVASVLLRGAIHKDMQLSNIGMRNGMDPVFLDFADITTFVLPEGLDKKTVKNITKSLFPLLDGIGHSFECCSAFRAGLIAKAGMLGHEIFKNAINNGFSSDMFEKHPTMIKEYDVSELYERDQKEVSEWKAIDLDSINLDVYPKLDEYESADIRMNISKRNQYYLDMLYLTRSGREFFGNAMKVPLACVYLNMASKAMLNGMPYTEYGLIMKCLKLKSGNKQIEEMAKQRSFQILIDGVIKPDSIDYILMCTDKYGLFELLWILDDEDTFNK